MMKNAPRTRILILGGGFAGLSTALWLERFLRREDNVEIVLMDRNNFSLFTPMLPEVASGGIEAKHIVVPIRACLRRARFQQAEVAIIDLGKREVWAAHCGKCVSYCQPFDHLILALGSMTNFFGLPSVAEHALPLKGLGDAIALHDHLVDMFEHADMEVEAELRRARLTFLVAGAGFAGAEVVAEINDFAHSAGRYYPCVREHEVRVLLVDPGSRIMPEVSLDLASYASRLLQRRGVEIRLQTGVRAASAEWVELTDGERIPTRSLIWTAGTSANPLVASLPCARERGCIRVGQHLEVPGYPGVWAIGDCAFISDPRTGRPYPATAQHAVRQGKVVARNIVAAISGRNYKMPFDYSPLGMLVALGRRSAVADIKGVKFSGFVAWWLWRTFYLSRLPGWERKLRVAFDWTLDLVFARDIIRLTAAAGPMLDEPVGESQRSLAAP